MNLAGFQIPWPFIELAGYVAAWLMFAGIIYVLWIRKEIGK